MCSVLVNQHQLRSQLQQQQQLLHLHLEQQLQPSQQQHQQPPLHFSLEGLLPLLLKLPSVLEEVRQLELPQLLEQQRLHLHLVLQQQQLLLPLAPRSLLPQLSQLAFSLLVLLHLQQLQHLQPSLTQDSTSLLLLKMLLECSALEEQLHQQQLLRQIHSEPLQILDLHLGHQTLTLEQHQPALVPALLGLGLLLLLLQVGACLALGLVASRTGPVTHRGGLPPPGGQENSRQDKEKCKSGVNGQICFLYLTCCMLWTCTTVLQYYSTTVLGTTVLSTTVLQYYSTIISHWMESYQASNSATLQISLARTYNKGFRWQLNCKARHSFFKLFLTLDLFESSATRASWD